MNIVSKFFNFLRAVVKTLRLALPKLGVGWMFALLTINFNRITIVELDIAAIAVTAMLAIHYVLSPFQVISGRFADRNPILGMRRTPYFFLAAIVASLVFIALPSVAFAMGDGSSLAYAAGFGLLITFGIAIAVMGDAHHSLIAETVDSKQRGGVISVVWTFTILSTIIAAIIMQIVMPEYSEAGMQQLYNLTPLIVIGSALLGFIGIEPRLTGEQLEEAREIAAQAAPPGNPIASAITVLRENKQAWGFFAFIFISILSIFLQDNILEPFGAEVFGLSVSETTGFQPVWGGGVLIGMILIGALSVIFNLNKRNIALVGTMGTALGMFALATASVMGNVEWVKPSLMFMGFFTGFFNVGALSLMMDMTVEGATGLYMGLWGMAQAFGNGVASFGGGALHTGLIETGLLTPSAAYFAIFSLEAIGMVTAGIILLGVSVKTFRRQTSLNRADTVLAMEAGLSA